MPTVYQQGKIKFVIRLREPKWKRPHVHVIGPDLELSIALDDFEVLAVSGKISHAQVRRFVEITQHYREEFLETWRECHE